MVKQKTQQKKTTNPKTGQKIIYRGSACPGCGGRLSPLKSIPPKSRCVKCGAVVTTEESSKFVHHEFRILVCGSRDWTDEDPIRRGLAQVMIDHGLQRDQVLVVTGSTWEDDNGADSIIEQLCRVELGIACAIFRAPWRYMEKQGNKRAAGPMRNDWMLKWGRPDYVLAFHPYLPGSRGTKNMCKQAREWGIPVRVVEG